MGLGKNEMQNIEEIKLTKELGDLSNEIQRYANEEAVLASNANGSGIVSPYAEKKLNKVKRCEEIVKKLFEIYAPNR